MAIQVALSVQNSGGGTKKSISNFEFLISKLNFSRKRLLAATPPAKSSDLGLYFCTARRVFLTKTSTIASWISADKRSLEIVGGLS